MAFVPFSGVLSKKTSLKTWQKKYVQIFSDHFVYHKFQEGKKSQDTRFGTRILFTDICAMKLYPDKKNGTRFDLHLNYSKVVAFMAESALAAAEWMFALALHSLKAYTTQAYMMQISLENIPHHYIFLPSNASLLFIFRSPIPCGPADMEYLKKVLYPPDVLDPETHSRARASTWFQFTSLMESFLQPSLKETPEESYDRRALPRGSISSRRQQSIMYTRRNSNKKVGSSSEPHPLFSAYLTPLPSHLSIPEMNDYDPFSHFILPPADLSGFTSVFRHILDLLALVSSRFILDEEEFNVLMNLDELEWLNALGVEQPLMESYLRFIYLHDAKVDAASNPRDVVVTYANQTCYYRTLYYSFICELSSSTSFRRFSNTPSTSSLTSRRVSITSDLENSLTNRYSAFSLDILLIFFPHLTDSKSKPILNFILQDSKSRDSFAWMRMILNAENDLDVLKILLNSFMLCYCYQDFDSYKSDEMDLILKSIRGEPLGSSWPSLDSALYDPSYSDGDFDEKTTGSLKVPSQNQLLTGKNSSKSYFSHQSNLSVSNLSRKNRARSFGASPNSEEDYTLSSKQSKVPSGTFDLSIEEEVEPPISPYVKTPRNMSVDAPIMRPQLIRIGSILSADEINNGGPPCLYPQCKRCRLPSKRYCSKHCTYAIAIFNRRPLYSPLDEFKSISKVISIITSSDDFIGKLIGIILSKGRGIVDNVDYFSLIYPIITTILLTRQPRHICLNLDSYLLDSTFDSAVFPVKLHTKVNPLLLMSIVDSDAQLENSPHVPVSNGDTWHSKISLFSASDQCDICSTASKKFLGWMETHQPNSDIQIEMMCQTLFVLLLNPIWSWLLPKYQSMMTSDLSHLPFEEKRKLLTESNSFKNIALFCPFLHGLSQCKLNVRLNFVKMLNELLLFNSNNVEQILTSRYKWTSSFWLLFCDIPAQNQSELEQELVKYLANIIVVLLFQSTVAGSKCFEVWSDIICDLHRFGGLQYESLAVTHKIFLSTFVKLKTQAPKYMLSFAPDSVLWKNFISISRFLVTYVMATSRWGLGGDSKNSILDNRPFRLDNVAKSIMTPSSRTASISVHHSSSVAMRIPKGVVKDMVNRFSPDSMKSSSPVIKSDRFSLEKDNLSEGNRFNDESTLMTPDFNALKDLVGLPDSNNGTFVSNESVAACSSIRIPVSSLPLSNTGTFTSSVSTLFSVPVILKQGQAVQVNFPNLKFRNLATSFSFSNDDPFISIGAHYDILGGFMDIDLVERFISVMKAFGVDKFQEELPFRFQGASLTELDEVNSMINIYYFFEDLLSIMTTLQTKREFSGFLSNEKVSSLFAKVLSANGRNERTNILSTIFKY